MHVLVVDDDADIRLLLSAQIEEFGHVVDTCSSAEDALVRVDRQPNYDLLITDVRMPGMDGLQLLRELARRRLKLRCAVISAHEEFQYAREALRLQAVEFMLKPVTPASLRDVLMRVQDLISSDGEVGFAQVPARSAQTTLELPSHRWWIPAVCHRINVLHLADQERGVRDAVRVALTEALSNAVVHGNFGISSASKEADDWEGFDAQIEQCEQDERKRALPVFVTCARDSRRLEIEVQDVGSGFDVSTLPGLEGAAGLTRNSGRGIILIRHCFDQVSWNSSGTRIRMVREMAAPAR